VGTDAVRAQRAEIVLGLYERYFERVCCFVRQISPHEDAEDVCDEVFCRILSLRDLETKTIGVSYLLKTAENILKRRHRRRSLFQRYAGQRCRDARSAASATRTDETPTRPPQEARVSEMIGRLADDMQWVLSDREAETIRLIVLKGLSYRQAARSMGVSVDCVNNWKYRGLRKLEHHAKAISEGPDLAATLGVPASPGLVA